MSEYYTYLDVLERLRSREARQSAPPELVRAQPLPSRVTLTLKSQANRETLATWLSEIFGPRYIDRDLAIALDGVADEPSRTLPIEIERLDDESVDRTKVRLRPTLTTSSTVTYNTEYETIDVEDLADNPPVLTFHSFKGGMGRTTLALSLATALTNKGHRVLFIDADFEAPGVSSLLKHVIPSPRISFSDLLTLAHSSPHRDADEALSIVADRLQDQDVANLFILPCTRDLGLPSVSPDTLTLSTRRSPFFVGSMVSRLGRCISADVTIIDLRAGLSELVASLFLDPRLQHVLVTTLNGQAIDGTIMLLERMREMGARWQAASGSSLEATLPTVIINQVPQALTNGGSESAVASLAMATLEEELRLFLDSSRVENLSGVGNENPFQDASIITTVIEADPTVTILSRDLREAQRTLMRSTLPDRMYSTFGSLVPTTIVPQPTVESSETRRSRLAHYARESIFAESQPKEEIYPTASLVNLVERHQSTLPNVAVIGEKGAGKSYTFMSLALATTWGVFSQRLGIAPASIQRSAPSLVLPVTPSQDLDRAAREAERRVTTAAARTLSGLEPLNDQQIVDVVQRQLRSSEADSLVGWRDFWLDLIAWRAGFQPEVPGSFRLLSDLVPIDQSVVAIFDGIETLFSRLRTSEPEQAAVAALLRLVPDWLSQLPKRNVGCVMFIREDLARYALTNNYKQFEDRYSAYALRWNWAEASALALWIAQKAESISTTEKPEDLAQLDEEPRGLALSELWGLKMGPQTSREARSLEWTMSSLSDFNRRIKARDLVRFLAEAAERSSVQDAYPDGRLLSTRAMRDAVGPCSKSRVDETGEENPDLKRIFIRIQGLTGEQRELPWSYERALDLIGSEDVHILEDNGVLFRYDDDFFVPELYRSGLNLYYSGGARRKVVTLMRQAARRSV